VVNPILGAEFPNLVYSAALIGYGSDVLGYDTERSTDHEWGPRLLLFLSRQDHLSLSAHISEHLRQSLPPMFRGYSTHFGEPDVEGIQIATAWEAGSVNHKIEIHTTRQYFSSWIGLDPTAELQSADWLTLPSHKLLEVTAGQVFHDGLHALEPIRAALAYYPRDVWLYLMASQWRRIAQQEAFVGRTAEVGDECGSMLLTAALVRDLMGLCFLIERRYAPYSKWLGTAFARLACAAEIGPTLDATLRAATYHERQDHLARAYRLVAEMHNQLNITPPLDTKTSLYHGRPYRVIHAGRFVEAIAQTIEDPQVRAISGWFGGINQISDNSDVLGHPLVYRQLRPLYE
jgi:hypothetical protein